MSINEDDLRKIMSIATRGEDMKMMPSWMCNVKPIPCKEFIELEHIPFPSSNMDTLREINNKYKGEDNVR